MARPPISKQAAAIVWFRAKGHCEGCGVRLPTGSPIDHWPPLGLRERDPDKQDTDPSAYRPHANDTANLQLLCKACHDKKTFGIGTHRGDLQNIARAKRIAKDQEQFRQRLLAKGSHGDAEGAGESAAISRPARPKLKQQIRSAGFRGSRKFNGEIVWKDRK